MSGRDIVGDGPAEVMTALQPGAELLPEVGTLTHVAIFYPGKGAQAPKALDWAGAMMQRAAGAGRAVHIVVPAGTQNALLDAVGPLTGARVDDMADLGRNPARLIPAAFSLLDESPFRHAYCLWEPAWPTRSAAELHEVIRHEALVNLAFPGRPITVACLYDTTRLPAAVLRDAEHTHPVVISDGHQHASGSYLGGQFPAGCDDPLPPAAVDAVDVSFDRQLGVVREFSASNAEAAGLDLTKTRDLVLAVSEVAANALGHAGGGGVLRSWRTDDEFVCQIEDAGHITDPLAGRRKRPADTGGGHGLWMVNRLCDLVERRSGRGGTVTRLHMRLAAAG